MNIQNEFEELTSMNLLKLLFPDKYSGLLKSESPDFIDNKKNIGVEITSAMIPERRAQWNYMMQAYNKEKLSEQDYCNMKRFSFNMYENGFGKFPVGSFWGDYVDLISSYQRKILKINTVKSFQKYHLDLYINTMFMDDDNLTDFLLHLYSEKRDYDFYFKTIYIKSEGVLYVIKFKNLEIQRLLLNNDEFQKSKNKALDYLNNMV